MNWILMIAFTCGTLTQCPPESPFDGTAMWIGYGSKLECFEDQGAWILEFKKRNPGMFERGNVLIDCIPNNFSKNLDAEPKIQSRFKKTSGTVPSEAPRYATIGGQAIGAQHPSGTLANEHSGPGTP